MKDFTRRDFMGWGAAAVPAALGTLGALGTVGSLSRTARAASALGTKKMLIIFLRGGNDALNTVVPAGDPQYFGLRPRLQIPTSYLIDLGNGHAAFHPSLAKLHELYLLGQVAAVQRVGYEDATLSHFFGQRYLETGLPGERLADEGFVTRWARNAMPGSQLPAVCCTREIQRMFKGRPTLPHIPSIDDFQIQGDKDREKLLSFLRRSYATGSGALRQQMNEAGVEMADLLDMLKNLPPHVVAPDWYPTDQTALAAQGLPSDEYASRFFVELRDAVRLLKQTECRVAGVEIPLWDMHAGQGHVVGRHPDHLAVLAHGMRSVRLDTLTDLWQDLVVVAFSEFGRTSAENAGFGTDHGKAGVFLLAGGNVRGGVYNCDSATWPAGQTLLSDSNKWVAHLTDYRAVLGEVFDRHMGSSASAMEATFPGWSGFNGPAFQYLGLV